MNLQHNSDIENYLNREEKLYKNPRKKKIINGSETVKVTDEVTKKFSQDLLDHLNIRRDLYLYNHDIPDAKREQLIE